MVPRSTVLGLLGLGVGLTFAVFSCSESTPSSSVLISVASSQTDVFETFEHQYEELHPDVDVRLNVGGSTTLINQIDEGASVDVVVVADQQAADAVTGSVVERQILNTNELVAIRFIDGPTIQTVHDLGNPELLVSACDESLPCGRLTEAVLDRIQLVIEVDSREPNVRLVRSRVAAGEVDVGFVYRSDLKNAPAEIVPLDLDLGGLANDVVVLQLTDSPIVDDLFEAIVSMT